MTRSVWIVERNHEPLIVDGKIVAFHSGPQGTIRLRKYLNRLMRNDISAAYYDGVLYEPRQQGKLIRGEAT